MRVVEVWFGTELVGSLRIGDGVRPSVELTYAPSWLRAGFSIDPELPLTAAPLSRDGSLFGALADSAPDRWGRGLLARSHPGRALDESDYLLMVNDESRQGALRYRDEGGEWLTRDAPVPWVADLESLRVAARAYEEGARDPVRELVAAGAGMGGARPKATVRDHGGLWIAKFGARQDSNEAEVAELVVGRLALRAGIRMSEMRLVTDLDEPVLLSRRFDRAGDRRLGYLSANSLLQALVDPRRDSFDYLELADVLPEWSAEPTRDLHELWRRVAFGCLVRNTDDHMRNHAFLRAGAGWRLSPAFDINTDVDQSFRSASTVDGKDGPDKLEALLAAADYFRLDESGARAILDDVTSAVAGLDEVLRDVAESSTTEQLRELLRVDR